MFHKVNCLLMLIVAAVIAVMSFTAIWRDIDGRAFDILSTASPMLPDQPGITIIAIDEPSMAAVGQQWPWSRSTHAELITKLREAGAKAIAFDVIFAESSDAAEDQLLIDAMGPDVILAGDESLIARSYGTTLTRTEPMRELLDAGARFGIASLSMDSDGVLRTMPRYSDGFMATLFDATTAKQVDLDVANRRIQYFGAAGSYPTVSYYQALDPEAYLPPDYFKDQIIIVGFALQANADVGVGAVDAFETSYTLQSRQLTSGVEVQATIFDNIRSGLTIRQLPQGWTALFIALGAILAFLISQPKLPWQRALCLGIGLVAIVGTTWLFLQYGRLWVSPIGSIAAATIGVVAIAARDFSVEQKRRREVQLAFGQYLSPEMVQKIADNPELLNLGGESRELTILFSDIRGFTAISETMKDNPQGLTQMINAILTPLSDIIIEHGGTIDKYMGDCVMAFWNAPLDDPDHAQHAVEAGRAMLDAMVRINRDIAALLPEGVDIGTIKMGVGINTGTCVVGNIGSERRFDYSVLGDAVNLASRLEGQCKEHAVDILIGQTTIQSVQKFRFRKVADIKVRGRSITEAVYTFE